MEIFKRRHRASPASQGCIRWPPSGGAKPDGFWNLPLMWAGEAMGELDFDQTWSCSSLPSNAALMGRF
jgi:hypothetical protein